MMFAKDLAAPNNSTGLSQLSSNDIFQDFEHTTITPRATQSSISTNLNWLKELEYLKMPGTASSSSLIASLPSFMSIFGNGADLHRSMGGEAALTIASSNKPVNVAKRPSPSSHFSSPIIRRDSASTFESADSSPTTTISTLDSALTEPSPSSSPESPTAQLPLSSLKANLGSARGTMESKDRPINPLTTLPGLIRADSPNKKMRNTKNLIVNTTAFSRQRPSLPKLALSTAQTAADGHPFSAPPTPSFIVPPKPPRRRPSNLGLTLSTADAGMVGQPVQEGLGRVPPTPSERHIPTLNYAHLSSNTPLFSPTVAPEGGMRLPPFGNSSIASRLGYHGAPFTASYQPSSSSSSSSSTSSSYENVNPSGITRHTLDHVQEERDYELPLSREAKSPAYPQGPVCIYEPSVYLYLEPTAAEASEFDVVLNVAREVKNPFATATATATSTIKQDLSRTGYASVHSSPGTENPYFTGRGSVSEPQTAISDEPFRPTFEVKLPDRTREVHETPKIPRPTPEYIHVPWDHNTNVVDDLLRLCELIDDRVRQQKRVLIHCQCGVSRSASLVVAYGLFRNPQLTVQDAYNIVKGQSRWIGPNMNLIYQLSEFKSKLLRGQAPSGPAWHSWRNMGSGRPNLSNAAASRSIVSPGNMAATQQDRSTGPFPAGQEPPPARANSWAAPHTSELNSDVPFQAGQDLQPVRANSWATPHTSDLVGRPSLANNVTTGPSSAPPNVQCYSSVTEDPAAEDVVPTAVGDQQSEVRQQLKEMDIDADPLPSTSADPGLDPDRSSPEPVPNDDKPHGLPAGFSSLSSRRQGPPQLSLRQETPGFASRRPPRIGYDHPMIDQVPPSPSIMSPRAVEFTASPFHRTVAGDLAGSSIFEQGLMSPKPRRDDPRSPVQPGDAPSSITRNIFGFL